jgi:hypothetical protein
MFDLRFHKYVRETLDWDEAPGTIFLNSHMGVLEKRKAHGMQGNARLLKDREDLRLYISTTYSAYFGVDLRIGEATMRNRHLIANHPVLSVVFD